MPKPSIKIAVVAAIGNQEQIGKDNKLLWSIPEDLARFKRLTAGKAVIMGRKTWQSLPESVRPLPGRENIILTRDEGFEAIGGAVWHSLDEAIDYAKQWSENNNQDEIFIIGGATIYQQALQETEKLYLTLVDTDKEGDAFFPEYEDQFAEISREKHKDDPEYAFLTLEKK